LFETVFGLPAHPLIVHAPIVFIPLLILAAVVYALAPFLRARIRWAVTLLAFVAPLSALLAKLSGDAFRARSAARGMAADGLAKIDAHRTLGTTTVWVAAALGVVTLLLIVATMDRRPAPRRATTEGTAAASGGSAATGIRVVLIVVTIGLASASGYYLFKTGDSGARMEWTGR